jgi:hypothetical protein
VERLRIAPPCISVVPGHQVDITVCRVTYLPGWGPSEDNPAFVPTSLLVRPDATPLSLLALAHGVENDKLAGFGFRDCNSWHGPPI